MDAKTQIICSPQNKLFQVDQMITVRCVNQEHNSKKYLNEILLTPDGTAVLRWRSPPPPPQKKTNTAVEH